MQGMARRFGFVGLVCGALAGACGGTALQPRDGGTGAIGAAGTKGAAGTAGAAGTKAAGGAGAGGRAGAGGAAGAGAGAAGTAGVPDGGSDGGTGGDDPGPLTLPDGSSALVDASSVDAGPGLWVDRTPDAVPAAVPSRRAHGALAYDPNRHKMVLFGGSGGDLFTTELGDTLEWDPSSGVWTNLATAGVPPAQSFANLLFDDRLKQVVEVGESTVYFWLFGWDGTRWAEPNSPVTASPTPRRYPAVAFDSGRGKIVVFGGGSSTALLDELWEWDPTSGWVNRTPTPRPRAWPTPRASAHALAYDAARGKSVLFSGGGIADLWEWDGATGTWTDRTPTSLPAAWPPLLSEHALVYDAARARTVVLGGMKADATVLASVWEWDGAAGVWTERPPAPPQQSWPLPLYGVAAAYDSDRHRVVMVGGAIGDVSTYTRQTWEWDGSAGTFTDRTTPTTWPRARESYAVTFDTQREKAVLMGGGLGSEILRDLWEWNDASGVWTDRTPDVLPPSWPGPGANAAIVYDPDRGKVLVASPYSDRSLYQWDPSTGTFTNLTPTPLPASWPPLGWPMVYDARRKRVVLVGGYAGQRPDPGVRGRVDTWELDPATMVWRTATSDDAPPARIAHMIAYDSRRGSVVLFGGQAPSIDTRFSDLWEWDGGAARWIDRTPSPLPDRWPPARSNHALAYSAARGRVVLFGGTDGSGDTWEWDGATGLWQKFAAVPASTSAPMWPPARVNHALTYDPARGTVVMFTGREPPGTGVFYNDVWDWGGARK